MKNLISVLLISHCISVSFYAQAQTNWAFHAEGLTTSSSVSNTYSIDRDAQGNIYVGGSLNGEIRFGSDTIISYEPFVGITTPDAFIAKFDPDGNVLWVKNFETVVTSTVWGIELDDSSNIYVVGSFSGDMNIDGDVYTSDNTEMFIARFDADGNIYWVLTSDSDPGDAATGYAITVGSHNDLFVSGWINGEVSIDGNIVDSGSEIKFITGRIFRDGIVDWFRTGGEISPNNTEMGVASDDYGNVYLTGTTIDSTNWDSVVVNAIGSGTFFLVRYDSMGNQNWIITSGVDSDNGVDVEYFRSMDYMYVTGYFSSATFTLGTETLVAPELCCDHLFIAKVDDGGTVEWAKQAYGAGPNKRSTNLGLNTDGSVLVSGYFGSPTSGGIGNNMTLGEGPDEVTLANYDLYDGFVARYDASGNLEWASSLFGSNAQYCNAVVSDGDEMVFVTGSFIDSIWIGDTLFVCTPELYTNNMYVTSFTGGTINAVNDLQTSTFNVQIFPNPSADFLNVTLRNEIDAEFVIYDLFGNQIKNGKIISNKQISVCELAAGMYFLELKSSESSVVMKFIRQ